MSAASDVALADIAKNAREILRIQVREYQGHRFVDLRVHFKDGDTIKPTPKGCTVKLDQIDAVIDALRQAKAVLEGRGMSGLQAALDYSSRGWPVFPVQNKVPLVEHGFKDATRNSDQISTWWRRWPRADVAVPTGAGTGLVVLDIDIDPTKGINGLDAIEDIGMSTHPATPTAHTPRGGLHLYFAHPCSEIRNSSSRIGRNIDVRGDGGSIVVPSGQRGRFWDPHLGLEVPLAPMPAWMRPPQRTEAARPAPDRQAMAHRLNAYCEAALDNAVKAITTAMEGQRRDTLNRECFSIGRLAGSGAIPPAVALDVLIWAGRQIGGFAGHQPDKIVRDAFTDGLRQPREVPNG